MQHKLIDLYVSPYMSSSVKLHIINALDQTTRLKEGLDWLLGRHHLQIAAGTGSRTDEITKEQEVKTEPMDIELDSKKTASDQQKSLSGYQRIIGIMLTKQVHFSGI